MALDFNYFLNRQGVRGKRGERGEQGFSPLISVKTQTANEYILTVQNEDGSFDTPNLRGNAIANNGGTYIRYNPLTEEMYTGDADYATNEQAGVVLLSTYAQLEAGGSEGLIPTSADVYDLIQAKITSIGQGYVTQTEFDTYTAATAITLNNLSTQKLSFADLSDAIVAGNNITLSVDSENNTITINAAGGDLSNYVTLDTAQTITGGKTFKTPASISLIRDSGFYFEQNAFTGRLSIGANVYGGVKRGGIIASQGLGAIIGTSGENSSCIYLPPNCKNPLIIKGVYEPWSSSDVDNGYPIWNESIVNAGSNITISANGSGRNKTYTISATANELPSQTGQSGKFLTTDGTNASWTSITLPVVDQTFDGTSQHAQSGLAITGELANYMDLSTNQTITGTKTFNNLRVKNQLIVSNGYIQSGGASDLRIRSTASSITLWGNHIYATTDNTNKVDLTNAQVTDNLVTSIDDTSSDTEYPSAKCVYDAIQSSVGNIETLLNNINSGSGS